VRDRDLISSLSASNFESELLDCDDRFSIAPNEIRISRVREAMIEYNDLRPLIHYINETFGAVLERLGEAFVQVGLGVVIWVGYVRHWVSSKAA
jgi:hypothetical protein